jgi:hypothetical protein
VRIGVTLSPDSTPDEINAVVNGDMSHARDMKWMLAVTIAGEGVDPTIYSKQVCKGLDGWFLEKEWQSEPIKKDCDCPNCTARRAKHAGDYH